MVGKLRCSPWALLLAAFLFAAVPNNAQALEQAAGATIRPPFLNKLIEYVDHNTPQEEEPEELTEEDITEIIFHRVQSGETVSSIADRYKSSEDVIVLNNQLNSSGQIQVGEVLRVTRGYVIIHEVVRGDTIWDIAALYKVSRSKLLEVNKVDNPEGLQIGDTLIIPANEASLEAAMREQSTSRTAVRSVSVSSSSSDTGTVSRSTREAPRFIWPTTEGWISSPFGPRKSGFHYGLDIAVVTGTPLKAIASGTVEFSGWRGGYGRAVILDHGEGWKSLYAHASSLKVSKGQQVSQGTVVALSGSTGNTTGPHVHLEIIKDDKKLNPINYLPKR